MTVETNGFIAIDRETRKLVRYVSFFFDFDLWPKIFSDMKILKLNYLGIEIQIK